MGVVCLLLKRAGLTKIEVEELLDLIRSTSLEVDFDPLARRIVEVLKLKNESSFRGKVISIFKNTSYGVVGNGVYDIVKPIIADAVKTNHPAAAATETLAERYPLKVDAIEAANRLGYLAACGRAIAKQNDSPSQSKGQAPRNHGRAVTSHGRN